MSAEVESKVADPTTESKAEEVKPVDATTSVDADTSDMKNGGDKNGDHNQASADALSKTDGNANGSKQEHGERPSKMYRQDGDRNGNSRGRGGRGNHSSRGRNTHNWSKQNKYDRRNIKSRYDDQEQTDDHSAIRKQVEFYFSDANLRTDKFLFEQIGGSENKPVDIKVIASFKRMQRFAPYSAVVAALKDSDVLDVVNADSPNNEQVVRKAALPADLGTDHRQVMANYESESMKRSIYVKGFGKETEKTQLQVEELFGMYGVTSVRLRRKQDGYFKGSAFIEFPSEDEMNQFLALDDESKPKWKNEKGEEEELEIESKTAYCKRKDDDINAGRVRPNDQDDVQHGGYRSKHGDRGGRGRGRGRGRFNNGGRGRFNDRRGRDRSGSRSRSRSHSRGDSRSRSRSRSRDLKKDDWKQLRDQDKRRSHRGRNEKDEKEDDKPKQEYDEAGIPKITTSESVPKKNEKKRAAEDEGDAGEKDVKKTKEGEV